ncbi:GIN domain-containing protein [Mucilaginibacter litoreus]|uniref:GIN domain-containing protein n=1 Tax=Mucilaginibacter litoreus TaxID=1048221 RepID=A0ABW3AND8_9SPHI
MKTRILTMVALMIMAVVTTKNTYANVTDNGNDEATVLTNVSRINKIEIRGNVELYVSDGESDKVKVYNKYYSESALVQSQNGVLRISSYNDQKLVVWVTAADLRAIAAYDNAEVKSFGKLSKIELDVNLYDAATVTLNLDAYKANVTVNDDAKANLAGRVNDINLEYAQPANINNSSLMAVNVVKKQVPVNTVAKANIKEAKTL